MASAADSKWNPKAKDFPEGAQLLRNCVLDCCREIFHMTDTSNSPIKLVEDNIPTRFDLLNEHPVGCIDYQLEVNEVDRSKKGELLNRWTVQIDADKKTEGSQEAHYGYTVFKKGETKFTGHVWLPKDPPYYRNKKGDPREYSHFGYDRKKGRPESTDNIWFEMKGKKYILAQPK